MSIKEVRQALGSWGITLVAATPRELIEEIERNKFGHIAIIPGRINPLLYGDGLLSSARYVGVYRSTFKQSDDTIQIKGAGMAFWLGDEDDKGDIFETAVVLTDATFPNSVRALLPPNGAVTEGTIHSIPGSGTFTNRFQWETPRKALTYLTDTYSADGNIVEFRVNGDGTLDAGLISDLYNMTPKAILVKKDTGRDMRLLGLRADMSMDYDVEDLTTRVVLLAQGEGNTIATGSANATPTGYLDIHGNPIKQTRLVSESETEPGNADVRAQLQLQRWSMPRQAIQIKTDEFDVKGDFVTGDYIYVFDPEAGFYDLDNEVFWRGQPINPIALRVVEMDWNVRPDWTVAFRKNNGEWLDLSEYYKADGGGSTIAVGDYRRTLAGNNYEPLGFRANLPASGEDSTIPGVPAFTGFSVGSYQSETMAWVKSAIRASWSEPNNVDGSTVTDGSHYEIRHRANETIGYPTSWDILSGFQEDASDDFARSPTSTDGWGTSTSGDGWGNAGGSSSDYEAGDGSGRMTLGNTSSRTAFLSSVTPSDVMLLGSISTGQLSATEAVNGAWGIRRAADGTSHIRAEVRFNTDGNAIISLERLGAGSASLDSYELGAYAVGQKIWIRIVAIGTSIKAKAWFDGFTEPSEWQLDVTEVSITSGHVFARSMRGTGNTNNNALVSYGDLEVVSLTPSGAYSWDDLGTWDGILSEPVSADPQWNISFVGWDSTSFTIMELTPGVSYELQIRAVDSANPPNRGAWSASSFVTTIGDIFPPSTPAAPVVAGSMVAIQVQHNLGKSSGGEFNLEADLHHLDVHVGGFDNFLCTSANKVGELIATGSMVTAGIPAVGSFKIDDVDSVYVRIVAVDISGNKSPASSASTVTVDLIDDAHISNLTVSKVTAGTITATWIMAGAIKTSDTGARVELNSEGLEAFNSAGVKTVDISSSDGSAIFTGTLQTSLNDAGITFATTPQRSSGIFAIHDGDGEVLDHIAEIKAYETVLGDQAIEIAVKDRASEVQDGGKLLLTERAAILSYQPDGSDERYIAVDWPGNNEITINAGRASDAGTEGVVVFLGRWYNYQIASDPSQSIFTAGGLSISNGPALNAFSYGPTMTRTLYPVLGLQSNSDSMLRISAQSNTGFTVGNSGATSASINVWAFAADPI